MTEERNGGNGADPGAKEPEAAPEPADAESAAPPDPDPLAKAIGERDRYREQMLRTAADFDNFRKRARRELEEMRTRGREDMLKALLPVFDNFERALEHAGAGADAAAIVEGLAMVQKLLADTLERSGVSIVAETGVPFDPAVHDALQQEPTREVPPGTVMRVVQKGYRVGERLVRPASVLVAAMPPEPAAEAPDEGTDGSDPPPGR